MTENATSSMMQGSLELRRKQMEGLPICDKNVYVCISFFYHEVSTVCHRSAERTSAIVTGT